MGGTCAKGADERPDYLVGLVFCCTSRTSRPLRGADSGPGEKSLRTRLPVQSAGSPTVGGRRCVVAPCQAWCTSWHSSWQLILEEGGGRKGCNLEKWVHASSWRMHQRRSSCACVVCNTFVYYKSFLCLMLCGQVLHKIHI